MVRDEVLLLKEKKCMKKYFIIIVWILGFSINIYSQSESPILNSFRIESIYPNRVFFNSSVPIKGVSFDGFKIEGMKIIGIRILKGKTSGHYIIVEKNFTFWDNHLLRYEGGSDIQDMESHPLHKFIIQDIKNFIKEPKSQVYAQNV